MFVQNSHKNSCFENGELLFLPCAKNAFQNKNLLKLSGKMKETWTEIHFFSVIFNKLNLMSCISLVTTGQALTLTSGQHVCTI